MAVSQDTVEYKLKVSNEASGPLTSISRNVDALANSFKGLSAAVIVWNQGIELFRKGMGMVSSVYQTMYKNSIDLQRGVAGISTLFDSTSESTRAITQQLIYLQRQFGTSQQDVVNAYYEAIASGAVDASNAMGFLVDAQKLAIGGMTSLKVAVDGLTGIIAAYGLKVSDAKSVNDALFIGAAAGKTNIEELTVSLGQAAALAKASGVSYRELIAATSALTAGGVATAEAVTQVRSAMVGLTKQTPDLENVLFKLGIKSIQTEITQNGLVNTMKKIVGATDGSTESLVKLFGRIEAVNAVIALTNNTIGKKFVATLGEMEEKSKVAGQVTDKAFGKISNTVGFQLDRLGAKFRTFFTKSDIDATFTPIIAALNTLITTLDATRNAISKIDWKGLIDNLKSLVVAIGIVTLAFKAWALVMSAGGSIKLAVTYLAELTVIMIKDAVAMAWVAAKWVAIAAAITAIVIAIDILIRNMGKLKQLFIAVGDALYNVFLRIQKLFWAMMEGIFSATESLLSFLNKYGMAPSSWVESIKTYKEAALGTYQDLSKEIVDSNKEVSESFKDIDMGIAGQVYKEAAKWAKNFNSSLDALPAKAKEAGKELKGLQQPPLEEPKPKVEIPQIFSTEQLKLIGATMGQPIMNAASTFSGAMSFGVTGWLAAASMILDAIQQIINIIPSLLEKIANIFNSLTDLPNKIIGGIKNVNAAILNLIENLIPNIINAVLESFDIAEKFPDMVMQSFEKLASKFPDMVGKLALVFMKSAVTALPKFITFYIKIWTQYLPNIVKNIVGGIITAIPEIIKSMVDELKKALNDLAKALGLNAPFKIDMKKAQDELKKIGDNITRSASDVFSVIDMQAAGRGMDIADRIRTAIDSATTRAKNVFQQLWDGLVKIWREWWDKLVSAWRDLWDAIVNAWRWVWDNIISPIWNLVTEAWRWVYDNVIMPIWNFIVGAWRWVWDNVISPIYETVVSAWRWIWDNILQPVISAFQSTFQWIYDNILKVFLDTISSVLNGIINLLRPMLESLGTLLSSVAKTIEDAFSGIINFFKGLTTTINDAFSGVKDFLGQFKFPSIEKPSWWPSASGGLVLPSSGTILNQIADNASTAWKRATTIRFAEGGMVPMGQTRNGVLYAQAGAMAQGTDTVPAMLTPGEFIVNREAARYNLGLLAYMNKIKSPLSPVAATSNISVIINAKTDLSPEQIRREVIPTLEKELRRKSQDGKFMIATSGLRTNK